MPQKNLKIFIQICSNCKQHSWCTRHKEQVYLLLAKDIQTHILQAHSDVQVMIVPVGGTKMGSFQITCQGIVLFSKLELGYFPHTVAVTQKISKFIGDLKNGKDLSSYENRDQSPVKCNSNYNRSPSPKHSPMRKTNPTAFKTNQYTKQQSNVKSESNQPKIIKEKVLKKQTQQSYKEEGKEQTKIKLQPVQNSRKLEEPKNIQRGQVILPTKNQQKQAKKPEKNIQNVPSGKQKERTSQQQRQHKNEANKNDTFKQQQISKTQKNINKQTQQSAPSQKLQKKDELKPIQPKIEQINNHQTNKQQKNKFQLRQNINVAKQSNHAVQKKLNQKQPQQSYEKQFKATERLSIEKQASQKHVQQAKIQIQAQPKHQQIHQKNQNKVITQVNQDKHQQKDKHKVEQEKSDGAKESIQNKEIVKDKTKNDLDQQRDQFSQDCRAAFDHYDKDKSGFLDKTQMSKFFADLLAGMNLSPQKLQQFKAKFLLESDANKDEKIQFKELLFIAKKIIQT